MFKVNNKDTRTTPMTSFPPCSTVSIVNFEQVNADWGGVNSYADYFTKNLTISKNK